MTVFTYIFCKIQNRRTVMSIYGSPIEDTFAVVNKHVAYHRKNNTG